MVDTFRPISFPWPVDVIGTDDYLEAMKIFTGRVQAQIELTKAEQERFNFNMTPITKEQCIPDNKNESIVGKVVVMDAGAERYEYQHSASQIVLADGGNGALGGREQAVFGTCLRMGRGGGGKGIASLVKSNRNVCRSGQKKHSHSWNNR